jgi:hypothetical protein
VFARDSDLLALKSAQITKSIVATRTAAIARSTLLALPFVDQSGISKRRGLKKRVAGGERQEERIMLRQIDSPVREASTFGSSCLARIEARQA